MLKTIAKILKVVLISLLGFISPVRAVIFRLRDFSTDPDVIITYGSADDLKTDTQTLSRDITPNLANDANDDVSNQLGWFFYQGKIYCVVKYSPSFGITRAHILEYANIEDVITGANSNFWSINLDIAEVSPLVTTGFFTLDNKIYSIHADPGNPVTYYREYASLTDFLNGNRTPTGNPYGKAMNFGSGNDNGWFTENGHIFRVNSAVDRVIEYASLSDLITDTQVIGGNNPLGYMEGYARYFSINDFDKDGVIDNIDNCPITANANQVDSDNNGTGDACEPDSDHNNVDDNDEFNSALEVSLIDFKYSVNGSNENATSEPGEPDHAGIPAIHSLWWHWVAPKTGVMNIDTLGSVIDTRLGVYTGESIDTLSIIASNDDFGDSLQSKVTFNAVSGKSYYIAVDSYDDASTGKISLNLNMNTASNIKLISPSANEEICSTAEFDWTDLSLLGARYNLNIANDSQMTDIVSNKTDLEGPYALVTQLVSSSVDGGVCTATPVTRNLFWNVDALDGNGNVISSTSSRSVTVKTCYCLISNCDTSGLNCKPGGTNNDQPGTIEGIVYSDQSTVRLAGATASITSEGLTKTTDVNGNYIMLVPPGTYSLALDAKDHVSKTVQIVVSNGEIKSSEEILSTIKNTLQVNITGDGSGTVLSTPAGINCTDLCSIDLPVSTDVSLDATPDVNSLFTGWQDDCSGTDKCLISMNTAKTVSANFITHTINITSPPLSDVNPVESGGTTNLHIGAVDSAGHILSYSWSADCPTLGNNGVFNPGSNTQNPSWTAPENITTDYKDCALTVTADDGAGLSKTETITQTIKYKDSDNDNIGDKIDNCPYIANINQKDSNGNGIGDSCDTEDDSFINLLSIFKQMLDQDSAK